MTSLPCTDISITKVNSIQGDVSVNQRKGRVKQLFDLEIAFEYKNTKDGSSGTGFISDFTADYEDESDLNLKLTPRIEQVDEVLKAVGEVVKAFKNELHEVHGKPLLLEAIQTVDAATACNAATTDSATTNSTTTSVATSTTLSQAPAAKLTQPSASQPSTTATITDEVTFPCPPDQLYLMLTDPSRIRSWTRSSASIPQLLLPGASFTLFDGNISCKLLSLTATAPQSIEMEWKLRSWTASSHVIIDIGADKQGNGSVLKMKQTGVPNGEAEITKNNWHNYYWNPIKRAFGVL